MDVLPAHAWREYRGTPLYRGANMTTHLALIQSPSGRQHRCFVKMAPTHWPMPLTEAIAWIISDALNLPRPAFAAPIIVPIDRLHRAMPLDQHWLAAPTALGFCTEAVEGKGFAHTWKWVALYRTRRFFMSPGVRRIAAFDEWLENRDRHTGNVIKRADGEYIPIDNEFVLYSVLWNGIINVTHQGLLREGRAHLRIGEHQRFQVEVALAAKEHALALQAAVPRIEAVIRRLCPPPLAHNVRNAVLTFLTPRADSAWMSTHLGVIA